VGPLHPQRPFGNGPAGERQSDQLGGRVPDASCDIKKPGDTLAGLLEQYEQVGRRTDELVATLSDLDADHPLPEGWFEPAVRWSARRVLLHVIAETAQHAGHADIIRESLDGARSMG
jgi:hypothetical protein